MNNIIEELVEVGIERSNFTTYEAIMDVMEEYKASELEVIGACEVFASFMEREFEYDKEDIRTDLLAFDSENNYIASCFNTILVNDIYTKGFYIAGGRVAVELCDDENDESVEYLWLNNIN